MSSSAQVAQRSDDIIDRALLDIIEERERQDAKWGQQNHDPFKYLSILGEEYGEACKAAVDAFDWKNRTFGGDHRAACEHLRTELVQVAAVAKAFIECIDRGKWRMS